MIHMSKALMRVPIERVEKAILLVRGEKVMLDRDLAALYEIPTKALKQAVRRNIDRFPDDFMFVLDKIEFDAWRSQFVTSIKFVQQECPLPSIRDLRIATTSA